MAGETLSNSHPYVTEETNDADELDPVLVIQPEDGVRVDVRNLSRGDSFGVPIHARFRDGNNDPIPINSSLTWMFRRPGDEQFTVVGKTRDNIQPWVTLDLDQQMNSDNAGATTLRIDDPDGIGVTDVQEFALALESSEVLDWTYSQVFIDDDATRTRHV